MGPGGEGAQLSPSPSHVVIVLVLVIECNCSMILRCSSGSENWGQCCNNLPRVSTARMSMKPAPCGFHRFLCLPAPSNSLRSCYNDRGLESVNCTIRSLQLL